MYIHSQYIDAQGNIYFSTDENNNITIVHEAEVKLHCSSISKISNLSPVLPALLGAASLEFSLERLPQAAHTHCAPSPSRLRDEAAAARTRLR